MRVIITFCPKCGILLTFASRVSSPVDLKFHESTTCILEYFVSRLVWLLRTILHRKFTFAKSEGKKPFMRKTVARLESVLAGAR